MRCHACLLKCSCGERGVLALGIWCIFSPSTAFICLLLWLNLHTYFLRHQRRLLAYGKMSQARTLQWYSQPLLNLLNCVCETVLLLSCSHMTCWFKVCWVACWDCQSSMYVFGSVKKENQIPALIPGQCVGWLKWQSVFMSGITVGLIVIQLHTKAVRQHPVCVWERGEHLLLCMMVCLAA